MVMPAKWLRYVPAGVQGQPQSVFLATIFLVAGIPSALGEIQASDNVKHLMPLFFIQGWGVFVTVGSILWMWGVLRMSLAAEKAGLRLLAVSCLVYTIAIFLSVRSWHDITAGAGMVAALCLWFVLSAEVRVAVIKALLSPWEPPISTQEE